MALQRLTRSLADPATRWLIVATLAGAATALLGCALNIILIATILAGSTNDAASAGIAQTVTGIGVIITVIATLLLTRKIRTRNH